MLFTSKELHRRSGDGDTRDLSTAKFFLERGNKLGKICIRNFHTPWWWSLQS
jgi:hypothetical protein